MGFLSGIVHAIGSGIGDVENFFGGGPKKKQQGPAQPQPQNSAPQVQNSGNQNGNQNFQNNYAPQIAQQRQQDQPKAPTPFQDQLTLLNQQNTPQQPDANSLQKANAPQPPKAAPAQHESLLSKVGNAVTSPFRPLGEGIARLLPGGQNDIKANEASIASNAKNLEFYAAQHKAGRISDQAYAKALSGVSQDNQINSVENKRIGDSADRSKVVGSAIATASAPFTASIGLGGTLLSKVLSLGGVGALEGANNELSTNANPTLKGALEQGAIGGVTGGALPVLGSVTGPLLRKAGTALVDKGGEALDALTQGGQSIRTRAAGAVDRVNQFGDSILPGKDPAEVSAGVKSVNPNGQQDVADHIVANHLSADPQPVVEAPVTGPNGEVVPQVSHEAPNAQAPQIPVQPAAPSQPIAPEVLEPHSPDVMHSSEVQQLKDLNEKAKTAALAPQEKNIRKLLTAKQELIQKANDPNPQIPDAISEAPQSAPATETPVPAQAPAPQEPYVSPHKNGKASVPGNNSVGYSTGDKSLDAIVNDSIIAHKGTAATAGTRGDALDAAGIRQTQRAEIRDIATQNVDKATGKISQDGIDKINAVIEDGRKTVGDVSTPVEKPAEKSALVDDVNAPRPASEDQRTAPNAPNTRIQAEKDLGDVLKGATKDHEVHDVLSRPEITAAGKKVADTFSDEEVVAKYERPVKFSDPHDIAIANASKDLLSKIASNGTAEERTAAQNSINNIIDGVAEVKSRSGQVLNYAQEMLKNLPPEQKAAYYIQKIDKENLDAQAAKLAQGKKTGDYNALSENKTAADAVHAKFTDLFSKDDALKSDLNKQLSITSKGADAATADSVTTKELQAASDEIDKIRSQREQNTGDIADYYKTLVPDSRTTGQKVGNYLGDSQRTAMLSSPSGRATGIFGTGITVGDKAIKQGVSGLLGKASNALFKTKLADTGADGASLVKGVQTGFQKSVNLVKGQSYVDNPDGILTGVSGVNKLSDLKTNGGNIFTRLVKASVAGHQNLSSGIYKSELLRLSRKAGIEEGLSGERLDKYSISHAANPDANTAAKAQLLHDTLNNVQSNPITDVLTGVAKSFNKVPYVGGLLKNQTIPFSHFIGGNIWNSITDRNVVAATGKLLVASSKAIAGKGDPQELIDALANTGVESAKTYALGYALTQSGMVTNKDAQGNNYEGAYIHFGNRAFPVTTLGPLAPAILLGNATYNGFHDTSNPSGSLVDKIGNSVKNTVYSAYKSYSGQQLLGGNSTLAGPLNQAFGKNGFNAGGLVKVGTNAAGQLIPAATGDVNAVLNNGLAGIPGTDALNKTHEAADTKVLDTNSKSGTAKDLAGSAVASLLNKVPIASQLALPRKAGVSAQDSFDHLTKGDHANGTEVQNAITLKSQTDQIAAYAKNPNQLLDPATTDSKVIKAVDTANKKAFEKSGKQSATINGQLYEKNVKGGTTVTSATDHAFQTSQGNVDPVQRAKDTEAFKASGKQQDTINGTVYQRSDDGKVQAIEQKDFDYKRAADGITEAKKAQDYTGYQKSSDDLLNNISGQLQNPNLSQSQKDALVNKAIDTHKLSAEYGAYGGFSKPKDAETFKGVGQLNGAKQYTPEEQKAYGTNSSGYVKEIQYGAAKYNIDSNALLAVSAMEGLGGGVGDGGHAFGPFQMNDAGGVLTGKYGSAEEARKYAESPQGIEDAIKQIAAVAKGLKGKAAIEAIVNGFERPADPGKEIAGAGEVYDGGTANLSASGGTNVIQDAEKGGKGSSSAANLIKSNSIGNLPQLQQTSFGGLSPRKISDQVPILQKILPSDLVKQRAISVSKVK